MTDLWLFLIYLLLLAHLFFVGSGLIKLYEVLMDIANSLRAQVYKDRP